jgi:hypothetical protein
MADWLSGIGSRRAYARVVLAGVGCGLVLVGGVIDGRASDAIAFGDQAPLTVSLPGRVFVLCGRDEWSTDVYELTADRLQRRTQSAPDGAVHNFAVAGARIALVGSGATMDEIRIGRLGQGLVTTHRVADGQGVALKADGTIAWDVTTSQHGGLVSAVWIRRPGQPARRVATYASVWGLSYATGRLDVVAASRKKFRIVRGVGGRTVTSHRLLTDRPTRVISSRSGRIAYNGGNSTHRRLRVTGTDAQHPKSFAVDWYPLAWSPDERQLLVGAIGEHSALGLMNPSTGEISSLGTLECGGVALAQWRATQPAAATRR